MSLQVNFTTHGHDLKATYESILRPSHPKNSNNWAMFGYDKGTNDLKVLGQGDGGLEELEDEFMDGKIQYAFARIIDPNTELNKFILIAWCGDGVPESKKGLFNSHLADVSNFLKASGKQQSKTSSNAYSRLHFTQGYHLQINARCEADVTPAQILKRVNEGSGSKYSVHKETYEQEKIRPLQSAYKRTEIPDIAAMQRNPSKPEPAPKYGLAKTLESTPSTPVPTTTPASVTRSWNAPAVNTPPPISAVKPAERTWKSSGASSYTGTAGVTFNKVAPPSSLLNYGNKNSSTNSSSSSPASSTIPATRNDPAMNKAQQMRLEREAREKEERERIKREIEASEARDRQAQGQSNAFKEAEEKRQREQREQEERQRAQDRAREEREAREKEERARADAEDAARSAREEMKAREQAAQEQDQKRQMEEQQRQREKEEKEAADKRAKQQREEEEKAEKKRVQAQEDERRRQEAEEEERERAAQAAAAAVQATAQAAASQVSHAGHEVAPGSVSAVVLYSYEQTEENEMSLIEGEVIVNVTELDVGWWSGESMDGTRSGLFPANYVEVVENAQDHVAVAPAAVHYEEEDEHAAHHVDAPASNGHARAEVADAASSGPSAVALYDYSAGEPNELSFAEGDVITDIEFVTEDWWNGTSNGASGLFPYFFPEHAQKQLTAQERECIGSVVGSSFLLLDLPLRYVLQYAMNHLQRSIISSDSDSNTERESYSRTVLIVTDSRTSLQEFMRKERQICNELYSSCANDDDKSNIHPWSHLWSPPHPPPPDEYSTETPTLSPITAPSIPSVDHPQESKPIVFRPDLWARIQIRYAPTIRHVQSLFRCLHLIPEITQGKTFGGSGGRDAHESVVPSSCTIIEEDVERVVTPPTLVILLGCFGHDRSLKTRRFPMLYIVPTFSSLGTFDETECVVDRDQEDKSLRGARRQAGNGRSSGAGGRVGRFEDVGEVSENYECGEDEEEGEELDAEELEELEHSEYIQMVANTMAEIKDSLSWLERSTGRQPELLVVEDTGQDHTDPSQLYASSRSTTTQQQQETMMPTVRELWLQTVLGFWVDAFIKTGPSLSSLNQQQQQEPRRESYRLWVRTQESLGAAFTTTATTASPSTWAEEGRSPNAGSGAPAASNGAVLVVQWHFDREGKRVDFEVVS
ncbi:hypothetical protein BGZ97_004387 [Linnemannia gamsii]|uniref:Uncharacterized protein n=1 Tax=Linnemannia gamsii TaxID=64522 RepID=A0A9P6QRV3_9FUNG|nr:hypothetical protein BGZ97_004387 [Linnemannia gamsii]